MGIKVSTSENNYVITVTPELKKILEEISNHNNDISSHEALISEIALKANQSTTYTKSEIESLLEALPTLDLSGQIGTHNTNASAHEDIRATLLSEIVRATTAEATKVDKITGKGLSTNDFTNTLMTLLNNQSGINTGDETQSTIISKLGGTGINSIGTCSTASATAAKTVTLSGFSLKTGSTILVKFTNANTVAVPTLNVNSTGAKTIYNEGGTAVSATNPAYFPAGSTIEFIYDGTNWVFKKRVVENYVNGTSWYRVYSDGWVEQGGRIDVGGTIGGQTVTLIRALSSTNYIVNATSQSPTLYASAYPTSASAFHLETRVYNYTTAATYASWEVKGY